MPTMYSAINTVSTKVQQIFIYGLDGSLQPGYKDFLLALWPNRAGLKHQSLMNASNTHIYKIT